MVIETQNKTDNNWINPTMLKWDRKRMGLKPEDIEALFEIYAEHIKLWENLQESPTLEELENLAEIYKCPVGYFFLKSPPRDAGTGTLSRILRFGYYSSIPQQGISRKIKGESPGRIYEECQFFH